MVSQLPDINTGTTPGYVELAAAFRNLQSALCAAAPPVPILRHLIREFASTAAELECYRVPEPDRPAQRRISPEVVHPAIIPYIMSRIDDSTAEAVVEFTDAHLGGNGAVHGGHIPAMFDDLLGIFVGMKAQPGSRTAYLKVNYRRITPINRPLRVDVSIDRVEGRKTFISGRLLDDGELCAEAEALFVRLLPGQP
ncbi:PaaI family thioesterase [Nocardia sp. NBC_00565]|uniref:PaaI family thioesterase n=1 Tax=Nocardia sp. NBC_00565 TaxID=2975993 RepID=UPI002E80CA3C|nr:PaaI family thioesterase [Nocardia sp. NBC_00565]WUC05707.1 PaaI family thioesterase [Nocardia sp. NBC_00565]